MPAAFFGTVLGDAVDIAALDVVWCKAARADRPRASVGMAAVGAAAVGVATAVLQAKVSPAWSIALIIAGWPLILGTIEDYVELPVGYDVAGNAMLIVIASVDVFLLCTVLMSALARRRAEVAAD